MKITFTPEFARTVKKMHPSEKASLDAAIQEVVANPSIGTNKVGDLGGIRVHKYKHHTQLMLLAYRVIMEEDTLRLLLVGTHENFYRDLKRH